MKQNSPYEHIGLNSIELKKNNNGNILFALPMRSSETYNA